VVGPGEEKLAEEVRAAAGAALPVVGLDLDVAALVGAMSFFDVLVANDSGPMHLAALFGTRVVGLFGPSDPQRTAPLGRGHQVLSRHVTCAPCTAHSCPLAHHECLRNLSIDEVDVALANILVEHNLSVDDSSMETPVRA
jgi:ADP-heptose:LPS heptosyltransferase